MEKNRSETEEVSITNFMKNASTDTLVSIYRESIFWNDTIKDSEKQGYDYILRERWIDINKLKSDIQKQQDLKAAARLQIPGIKASWASSVHLLIEQLKTRSSKITVEFAKH